MLVSAGNRRRGKFNWVRFDRRKRIMGLVSLHTSNYQHTFLYVYQASNSRAYAFVCKPRSRGPLWTNFVKAYRLCCCCHRSAPSGGNYHIKNSGTFLLSSGIIEQKRWSIGNSLISRVSSWPGGAEMFIFLHQLWILAATWSFIQLVWPLLTLYHFSSWIYNKETELTRHAVGLASYLLFNSTSCVFVGFELQLVVELIFDSVDFENIQWLAS